MNYEKEFELLAEKLLHDEISVEEHVEAYNRLIEKQSRDEGLGWRPHEHI